MINNSAQSPAPRRTPHLFEIRVLRTVSKIPREEHSTIPSKIILGVLLMGEHTSFTVNVFWSSLVLRTSYSGGRAGHCVPPNDSSPLPASGTTVAHPSQSRHRRWHVPVARLLPHLCLSSSRLMSFLCPRIPPRIPRHGSSAKLLRLL